MTLPEALCIIRLWINIAPAPEGWSIWVDWDLARSLDLVILSEAKDLFLRLTCQGKILRRFAPQNDREDEQFSFIPPNPNVRKRHMYAPGPGDNHDRTEED